MKQAIAVLLLLLPLILVSCSSTPPDYYVLHAAAVPPAEPQVQSQGLTVGLNDVQLPAYLDKSRLMRRTGDNTIEVFQNDQWSEPLDTGVERVLLANLVELLPTATVHQAPWPRSFSPQHRVTVQITKFDAYADGSVKLAGRWWITPRGGDSIAERLYSFHVISRGDSHADVAATMSEAVAELAMNISEALVEGAVSSKQ